MTNERTDRRTPEWRKGLDIALLAAKDISLERWCSGEIDVRDKTGKVIFSAPYWKLAQLKREVTESEGSLP